MLSTWEDASRTFNRGPAYWHYPHFSNQLGRPSGALRSGDYKLVENYETGKIELFNLAADPGEQNDLSMREPEKRRSMLADFRKWQKEVNANLPLPNPDYKKTQK